MRNTYPMWKYLLIGVVAVVGVIYATPNLFGDYPAVQVSASRNVTVDADLQRRVEVALEGAGLTPAGTEIIEERLDILMTSTADQSAAQKVITDELGRQYTIALKLAPATPDWLQAINALPMYLGLDLRGGVHFLMQVDMEGAERQTEERYASDVRSLLQGEKIQYRGVRREPNGGVLVQFRDLPSRAAAEREIVRNYPGMTDEPREIEGQPQLFGRLTEQAIAETHTAALDQNLTTLRNRVNELGVAEPVIQQQGTERIVVQLPGIQDSARAKEILGGTATLEFRMVYESGDPYAQAVPVGAKKYSDRSGRPVLLERAVMLTGQSIIDAAAGLDSNSGSPAAFITLDGKGSRRFARETGDKIGRPMGVVYIENKSETSEVDGEQVTERWTTEEVINVATIQDQLGKRFQITGLDSTEEAGNLALLLRAGALAAPITIIEERTVGPSLGEENIKRGFMAVMIGFALVVVFMALYYRVFGLFANVALALNLVLIVAVLSMLQATLTLPGIAGIVLTVGMAVDANVIIFERIREELRNGNSPQASIHAGYAKALSTIADANITTLIAAVVLFGFGTGPVKGFAVTLSIGILTSMFTAILGTRALANLYYGSRPHIDYLSIGLAKSSLPAPRPETGRRDRAAAAARG